MGMKALGPVDQMFMLIERRQQPMHVAGLQLFSLPPGADDEYVRQVVEHARSHFVPQKPFNQRMVTRLGRPYWEEDSQLDLEHHFRHAALPRPGRIRELLSYVSAEHSNPLHRERPLWESHLIEGLSDRRFAIYTKVHHGMMDGISAMRLGTRSLSTDPNRRDMPPVWSMPPRKRSPEAPGDELDPGGALHRMAQGVQKQLSTVPTVMREVMKLSQRGQRDPDHVSIFQAPQCMLSEHITGSRRFAAQSYSLSRIKRLARIYGVTLNDAVLAICGGALRSYLISHQALPDDPLIAMVPVSLRQDESAGGNQIAMVLANLGTHISDAAERLRTVKASVEDGKAATAQMTPEERLNFTALLLSPTFLQVMTGLAPKLLAFNVVISNVPGPREPLYWNGARLEGMYPASIVFDRMALNITLTSYCDSLEFGLIGCRRRLPSMQRLLDYLERAIVDLEVSAGVHAGAAE
jgi:diacylglycerol O-acyltransferase